MKKNSRALFSFTLFYVLGVLLGWQFSTPCDLSWTVTLGLFCLSLLMMKMGESWFIPVLHVCLLGAGVLRISYVNSQKLVPGSLLYNGQSKLMEVEGVVDTFPECDLARSLSTYALKVSTPEIFSALVTQEGGVVPEKGEAIRLAEVFKTARNYGNELEFDYEQYLQVREIQATAFLPKDASWKKLRTAFPVQEKIDALRNKAMRLASDTLSPKGFSLFRGIVFGDKIHFDTALSNDFRRSGILHVLVVSGFHITLVAWWIYFCFAAAGWLFPRLYLLIPGWNVKAFALLLSAAFFWFFTNTSVPSERAIAGAVVFAISLLLKRRVNALYACGTFFWISLMMQPMLLFDLSFLLTFAAVFGLLTISSLSHVYKPSERSEVWWSNFVREHAVVTTVATLSTMPVLLVAFRHVNSFAWAGNFILAPWYGFVLLPLGMMAVIVGTVCEEAGIFLFCLFDELSAYLEESLSWFSRIASPCEIHVSMPVVVFLVFLLGGVLLLRFPRYFKYKNIGLFACIVVLCGVCWVVFFQEQSEKSEIAFLHVGQGDATILKSPGGKIVLIDAGPGGPFKSDAGQRIVLPWLQSHGVMGIDVMILTHGDWDHVGGARSILESVPVHQLWLSASDDTEQTKQVEKIANQFGVKTYRVYRGFPSWEVEGLSLRVLCPFLGDDHDTNVSHNDASIGLLVTSGRTRSLLLGDLEAKGEAKLLAQSDSLHVDILKVGHHGSRTSTTEALLQRTTPKWAVISAGWKNMFHHPSNVVLGRFSRQKIPVFRTDLSGEVLVQIFPDQILLETFQKM